MNGPGINLNSGGAPGEGTPANPLVPGNHPPAAPPVCPVASPLCLKIAQEQDAPFVGSCHAACGAADRETPPTGGER